MACSCFAIKSENGPDGRGVDRHEPNENSGAIGNLWESLVPLRCPFSACKRLIEQFHVSLSPAATCMVHASHPLIPTLLSSQKSPDLKIGCAQLSDPSLETSALIRTMSVNVLMIMHDLKHSHP